MASSPVLLTCYCAHRSAQETCFSLSVDRATALVLSLLGGSMLLIGIYLMYCGIGTIPASMSGFALTFAGVTAMFTALVLGSRLI